ncbi:hypothetical protein C366_03430 [Cryptococcus neoformans Tu401-1]|nr:hypothetical protein C366_03430 [Cryptococcus neoformans var. grubii Tu401-1]
MSNSVQITPRKRKAGTGANDATEAAAAPTPRTARTSKRSVPANSAPIPFPTPPATRHRALDLATRPALASAPAETPKTGVPNLPPHLETLLGIQKAFNLTLSLYIATHHPVLPPHPPTATSVKLPNLTNYLAIKETVERTCGRRFGTQELGRLAWVWSWDGKSLADEESISGKSKEKGKKAMLDEDNPFFVPSSPALGSGEVSGMSYLITSTRTLDPSNGRRVYTHGVGIELELRKGETRQLLSNSDGGLGNRGQGGGTGAIGRWNANGESREDEFREKLEKWVELHGGYEPPGATVLPTPTTSETSTRSTIPPIPILPLPQLPSNFALPSTNLMAQFTSPSSASMTMTPKKNHLPPAFSSPKTAGLSDPFEIAEPESNGQIKGKIVRNGSVEARRKAMMERIKARSGANKAVLATLGSAAGGFKRPGVNLSALSAIGQQEELKRRSTLSRLESVAEAVWMMFSAPSPGPSTLPTPPRGRRKAIPMLEVAEVIVKSSKTPISTAEAQTSLQMLTELCPFFLTNKTIGRQDWLEMPMTALSVAPPSPTTSTLASSPSSSATPAARQTSSSPSTPGRLKAELIGPASPGRVRRQGGLREVRERIRRELGE